MSHNLFTLKLVLTLEMNNKMKFLMRFMALVLPLLFAANLKAAEIEIYYVGNLNGAIEPCGCSETGLLGGLQRHAVLFSTINREQSLLLSNGGLVDNSASTEQIKADYIFEGMNKLGYDAIALQPSDSSFGSALMRTEALPWVSSNLQLKQIPTSLHKEVNTVPVNIYTLAKVDADDASNSMSEIQLRPQPSVATKQGLNILLTSYHIKRVPADFDLSPYHVVIYNHRLEEGAEPIQVDGQIRLGPGIKGMYVGLLKGEWTNGLFKMTGHDFIKMDAAYDQSNALQGWYQQYQDDLKVEYNEKVALRKTIDSGQAEYQGSQACKTCHVSAYEKWTGSRHGSAFETLSRVEKQFDPSCIKCHVVGYNQSGGYLDEYITPHLQGVGCESCHGPGRDHIKTLGKTAMAPKSDFPDKCMSCHQRGHSPRFDYEVYFKNIAH